MTKSITTATYIKASFELGCLKSGWSRDQDFVESVMYLGWCRYWTRTFNTPRREKLLWENVTWPMLFNDYPRDCKVEWKIYANHELALEADEVYRAAVKELVGE
jgi:hypothetical protein